ncbi:hypothetical protein TWF730_011097 [Orbilia blumenaviensis]|uniref:F-box domain-containing protein n=1 Tax=Orbilia blumenaviensis TaxID=1796055 RepID=A0AAV9UMU8_9PEZI
MRSTASFESLDSLLLELKNIETISFVSLPSEIHDEIATYLPAFDIGLLSMTCRTLRKRLGPSNQHLWYREILNAGENHATPQNLLYPDYDGRLGSRFRPFSPSIDYWAYVLKILAAGSQLACGRCLSGGDNYAYGYYDHDSTTCGYVSFGFVYSSLVKTYCEGCFEESFHPTSSVSGIYPELHIPPNVQVWVGKPDYTIRDSITKYSKNPKSNYTRKSTVRRLIREQIGSVSDAKTQPSRFRVAWMIEMGKIADLLDQSIGAIVEEYTRSFKRFHPIIEPGRLDNCLWRFIVSDFRNIGTRNKSSSNIPLPEDTSDVIRSIGEYLEKIGRNPDAEDGCRLMAALRADEYLMRLFGARDGEPLDVVKIYHPEFLMDHMVDWGVGVTSWMSVFSAAFLGSSSTSIRDICCYWCLQADSKKQQVYKGVASKPTVVIPASSLIVHILQCHPDSLGKRPMDPIGNNWDISPGFIPRDPTRWKYPLEDFPNKTQNFLGYPNPMNRASDLFYR